jgi:uncharacterized protein (TIGR02996 family)
LSAEESGFFDAILAAPEDCVPRLIYADWLEDRGRQPQAELIRVQCALAQAEGEAGRLRKLRSWICDRNWRAGNKDSEHRYHSLLFTLEPPADQGEVERLQAREKELLQAVGDVLAEKSFPVGYYLGLPHAIRGAPQHLYPHLDAIARAFPTLALRLARDAAYDGDCWDIMMNPEEGQDREYPEDPHPAATRLLAGHRVLERCIDLEVLNSMGGEEVLIELIESPHLRNLRRLVVENGGLKKGVLALARPEMAQLTWLDLNRNHSEDGPLGDAELEKLVTCPHLERLEFLSFGLNQVTNEGARALAKASRLNRLRRLCLNVTPLGAPGVRHLAHSPHLTSIEFLELGNLQPPPGDEIVNALVGSPMLPRLRGLDLGNNGLTDEGLRTLGSSPATNSLRFLRLSNTYRHGQAPLTSPAGIRGLLAGVGLKKLRKLDLNGHPIDDAAAHLLAAAPFADMQELYVSRQLVSHQGLALLRNRFGDALRVF